MKETRNFRPTRLWVFLLLCGALLAAGCSTGASDSSANLVDAQGRHPAGWISTHPSFAGPDGEACQSCHGANLRGGISGVSCFTASFNGQACHAVGPTPANHQPIATWVNAHQGEAAAFRPTFSGCNTALCHGATLQGAVGPSCFSAAFAGFLCHSGGPPPDFHTAGWYVDHRAFAIANGTASCSIAGCHGATLHADPPGATGPSCFRATWGALSCHAGGPGTGGANHAVPFFDNTHFQATPATFTSSCAVCHAETGGTPATSPPPCTVCHTAGSPLAQAGCTSCHASPPSGAAGAYPNVAGAHAVHIALNAAGTPISCTTCHNGLGTNTLSHYNRANARTGFNALRVSPGAVALVATYNAATTPFSFDNIALTCLNVGCHGGQANVNWQTGIIDVNIQCGSCHVVNAAQFNAPTSGEHDFHVNNQGFACTVCHNTTTLAPVHFDDLATTAMTQAAGTVGGGTTSVATYVAGSCTPTVDAPVCHATRTWVGGN